MITTFDIFLEQTTSEMIIKLIYVGHTLLPTLSHGRIDEGAEEKDDDHLGEAVEENYLPSVLYNTYIQILDEQLCQDSIDAVHALI